MKSEKIVGTIYLPLSTGEFTAANLDAPLEIVGVKWSASRKSVYGGTYAYRTFQQRHIYLHQLTAGAVAGEEVDHKNGDTLDNRRDNLRACKHSENGRNLKKWSTPTSSCYKGVSFHKQSGKWRAYITLKGKQKYLGGFVIEEEAADAYDNAAAEFFGEFARLNFPCQ